MSAPSAILVDAVSGQVLFERDADTPRPPASLTKVMTALVALERGCVTDAVVVGPNPPKTGDSSLYLEKGERLSLLELLYGVLLRSANDACVAVAEHVAGSEANFVAMMNLRAAELGARHTHFANPHGLQDPRHYSSTRDLALISCEALRLPTFRQIIRTKRSTVRWNKPPGVRRLINKNRLLFRWPEADGVKTGYTRQAGRCLIASATRGRWQLLSVVLHSPDPWTESARLLKWGFSTFRPVQLVQQGEQVAAIAVAGAAGGKKCPAAAAKPLWWDTQCRSLDLPQRTLDLLKLTAPVAEGATVGWAVVRWEGREVARVPLVATEPVSQSLLARLGPDGQLAILLLALAVLILGTYGSVAKTHRSRRNRLEAGSGGAH